MISAVTDPNPHPPSTTDSLKNSNIPKGSFPNADSNDHCNSQASTSGNTLGTDANDDLLLLSKYSTHNDMMNYVHQYASDKGVEGILFFVSVFT